jgi:tetratricopeptide (TPR) repeat protein
MGHAELKTEVTIASAAAWRAQSSAARALKSEIVARWRQGDPADAAAELDRYPELHQDRAAVLDLVYEEYCLRAEAGENLAADDFCQRFPDLAHSLRKLINAHEYLQQNPHLWAGQQPEPVRWPEPGHVFLGFDLIGELGRGAFARVFLATEPALGHRHVVLKVAHQGAMEAETLGRLIHSNVVPVYSVHTERDSGLTAVCMPYLGSATLCDVIERAFGGGALPARAEIVAQAAAAPRRAVLQLDRTPPADPFLRRASYVEGVLHLGVQLADALAYTHSKGVLHLDLKPSNVLLSPEGRPMLLDFNLSRDPNLAERLIGGTLPYMSPEQLDATDLGRLGAKVLDARSDVFSLGVILYELLTGVLPFGAMPPAGVASDLRRQLRSAHTNGPRPIQHLNPQVDAHLARVVESCLAVDPAERPQSAAALAAALARGLSMSQRLRRWTRRHVRVLAPLAVLLFAAGVATAYAAASRDPYSVRQFEKGKAAFERGDMEVALEYFESAARDNSDLIEAEFYKGLVYQRMNKLDLALRLYEQLSNGGHGGRALAWLGYCQAKKGPPLYALPSLQKAVESPGATAETWNNLGYCRSQMNHLEEAEDALKKALVLDPNLAVAHENLLALRRRMLTRTQGEGLVDVPEGWLDQVERALTVCAASGDAHLAAANIYGHLYSVTGDAALANKALTCLERALTLGKTSSQPLNESAFRTLKLDPRFQALLGRCTTDKPNSRSSSLLIEPATVALR